MKKTLLFLAVLFSVLLKAQEIHLDQEIVRLHELSDSFSKAENYQEAIAYKLQELDLLQGTNKMPQIADGGEKLGLLYYHMGNYHASLLAFERTATFHNKTDNLYGYATIKINEANVYTRLGKYQQAIDQMKKAEEIYIVDSIQNTKNLVGLYTNLGLAYFDLPNLDSADYYYSKAAEYNQSLNNEIYKAVILNNRGDVFMQRDSLKLAEKLYLDALNIAEDVGYNLLIATCKLNLGTVYRKQADYVKALTHLEDALRTYEELNSLYFIAETNQELSLCYEKMGNSERSLHFLKKFNHLEDSLKGAETLDRIAAIELDAALENEQQRFEIIKKEKELAEAKSESRNKALYFLIAVILLAGGLIVVFIRGLRASVEKNRLKAENLEKELTFKKREIENFSTYIIEKNNMLEQVKNQLLEVKKEAPDSKVVKEALHTVKHNLHIDEDRKELELKIDQSHQEFMGRLLSKHPNLTKTDQRLCSLLLMELSTKDISNIMNVAPDSIKKSRNRLRKKLELAPKTDLTDFLKKV